MLVDTYPLDQVRHAATRVGRITHRTPVLTSRTFNDLTSVEAFFKCENFQRGGAFKLRGAANFIYQIPRSDLSKGVVTYSSGNHAQAVAIAAQSVDTPAVIVMPAEPFLKWLHRADSTSTGLTLEDLRREPTIYLLPTRDSEEEALGHLEQVCGEIFEEQLYGWYRVPSSWPVNRDFDTLKRWFECRFHSMLVDLCEDPLEHEEL